MRTFLFASLLGFSTFLACGEEEKETRTEPEGANPGECTDGADNDFDGDYDCNDSDCSGSPDCLESDCDDGADNDQDGDFDCDDSDCADAPECATEDDCADGADNDADGLFDCDDPDCAEDTACVDDFEGDEAGECTDGVDNDSDGFVDCDDPDCEGSPDCESTNDADGDGFDDINAGGDDCDDSNPNIYPMAGDTYGDGIDSDCDELDCESGTLNGVYFTACPDTVDQAEAKSFCQNAGYVLASLQSQGEQDFAFSLIDEAGVVASHALWIGYSLQGNTWVWEDGYSGDYENWHDADRAGNSCAVMNGETLGVRETGQWSDVDCSWNLDSGANLNLGYLCRQ